MNKRLRFSMEDDMSGKTVEEREAVFYGCIDSISDLINDPNKIKVEDQEQWEIQIEKLPGAATAGKLRVRKNSADLIDPKYEFTTKIKQNGANAETTIAASEDLFNQIKSMSCRGMNKRRFTLSIPGFTPKIEVDVFRNKDGKFINWVKIDIEHSLGDELPSIPEYIKDVVSSKSRSNEDQDFIHSLYDQYILTH